MFVVYRLPPTGAGPHSGKARSRRPHKLIPAVPHVPHHKDGQRLIALDLIICPLSLTGDRAVFIWSPRVRNAASSTRIRLSSSISSKTQLKWDAIGPCLGWIVRRVKTQARPEQWKEAYRTPFVARIPFGRFRLYNPVLPNRATGLRQVRRVRWQGNGQVAFFA
jgi:hypothetical protein